MAHVPDVVVALVDAYHQFAELQLMAIEIAPVQPPFPDERRYRRRLGLDDVRFPHAPAAHPDRPTVVGGAAPPGLGDLAVLDGPVMLVAAVRALDHELAVDAEIQFR